MIIILYKLIIITDNNCTNDILNYMIFLLKFLQTKQLLGDQIYFN